MKRLFDLILGSILLLIASPILLIFSFLIYWQDKHNPIYSAMRVGRDDRPFTMYKLRSMIVNADKSGVDSTAADDKRITRVGHLVRKLKLDELTQLLNVVKGDMSLVGPRPNVKRETDLYTTEERRLLSLRPGITDMASIVFSDEGDILEGSSDPDLDYNQLIRPGKGYLGLFYIENRSLWLDLRLMLLTGIAIINKTGAREAVANIISSNGGSVELAEMARRTKKLVPLPPPGATSVATNRDEIPQ